jgi:hypothetical protein
MFSQDIRQARKPNIALGFDGVTSLVNFGNPAAITLLPAAAWTIEVKIRQTVVPDSDTIFAKAATSTVTARQAHLFTWTGGRLWYSVGGSANLDSGIVVNDGKIHHIAFQNYMDTVWKHRAYVDGVVGVIGTSGVATQPTCPITIGARTDVIGNGIFVSYFGGLIDDLRIWDSALALATINANVNKEFIGNEAGLIAYWKMDEQQGNIIVDKTVNAITGTFTNVDRIYLQGPRGINIA